MKTLCIEGWRGVNHSFAMVNQNQILEMLKLPGWEIYHRDAPYFLPHWKDKAQLTSGFAPDASSISQFASALSALRHDSKSTPSENAKSLVAMGP